MSEAGVIELVRLLVEALFIVISFLAGRVVRRRDGRNINHDGGSARAHAEDKDQDHPHR